MGNNVLDIIIAHMMSEDAQYKPRYICRKCKAILGPALTLHMWPAGKKMLFWSIGMSLNDL